MSRTSEQISHMLQSSQRWHAGLQWYDFLLAIAFHQDGTGEMMYGENQGLRSDLTFRYEIAADMQIHFEFFGLPVLATWDIRSENRWKIRRSRLAWCQ